MVKSKSKISILMLSTIAMIVSFTVWSVFAPIATEIQKMYQLSDLEKSILIATPVLLGSVMRIPMGILTRSIWWQKDLCFDYVLACHTNGWCRVC